MNHYHPISRNYAFRNSIYGQIYAAFIVSVKTTNGQEKPNFRGESVIGTEGSICFVNCLNGISQNLHFICSLARERVHLSSRVYSRHRRKLSKLIQGNPFGRLRSICSQVLPEPVQILSTPLDALSSNLINGAGAVFSEIGLLRGIMDPAFRKHVGTFKKGIDTGNSLSWALYELASNPAWQERVREEIVSLQNRLADTEEVVSSVKLDVLHV
ncbi:hypothetical protein EV360DRAFT_74531 [Lentinula raphanica]|nr:hypothetical protein EV360DRAFT_74531 [Lentinula raphanica]